MSKPAGKSQPLSGEVLNDAIKHFRDQFSTVLIASTDGADSPDASYAPYIIDSENRIHIFVSRLAQHTGNLLQTGTASLLFIQDETQSANLFARQRLSYQCQVDEIPPNSVQYAPLLDQMTERFGPILKTLRQLPDFHLLRLTPISGHYVEGFGKAYSWQGSAPDISPQPVNPISRNSD